jgi:predicted nucleic acid-binding protein
VNGLQRAVGNAGKPLNKYISADLDFVDCCLTAIAERLNITQICTFDRRDFSIIRPKHVHYFE